MSVDHGARSLLGDISPALRTSIVLLTAIAISGILYFIPFAIYHLVDEVWNYVAMIVALIAFAIIGNLGAKFCPHCGKVYSKRAIVCPSCNYGPKPSDSVIIQLVDYQTITRMIAGMACGLIAASAIRAAQTLGPGDAPNMTYSGIALFGTIGTLLGYMASYNRRRHCPKCGMYMGPPETCRVGKPRRASSMENRIRGRSIRPFYLCIRCDEEFPYQT